MRVLSLRIVRRFLRRGYGRLALTVVALAIGVALVSSIDLVNRAVLRAFGEIVDTMAGRAALQVAAGGGGLMREELADAVASVSGVERVVPVVEGTAFTADESGELLTVYGVDVANDSAVRVYDAQGADGAEVEDPLVFLSQPDSIMLTRAFADRRHIALGQRITLVTPKGNLAFVVRGLLNPSGIARVYGGSLVVMDVLAAERVFTEPGFVNRFDVVVRSGADLGLVEKAIEGVLPAGIHVERPAQRKVEVSRLVGSLQGVLQGLGLVALVASFLIVFNRLSTVFERRLWQLGVMRAVGARRRVIVWELVKESLVLGGIGACVGVPLGLGLARILLPVIATTTALNYKLVAPEAELHVSTASMVLAAAEGILAAMLGALVPAWRASGVALAEVVRGAGREGEAKGVRPAFVRLGVLSALCATIAMEWTTGAAGWGLAATALMGVMTALIARPLLAVIESPLVHGLRTLAGVTGLFAARTLSRQPRRAGLTVGILGVGVGAVVWLWTVGHSFEMSVLDTLGHAFRADLVLSSSHVASGFDDSPFDGSLVEEARHLTGVAEVIGERITDWRYAGGPIALDAFDPDYFTGGNFGRWRLVGSVAPNVWETIASGEGVLVSTSFVRNLGARVGDVVVLETPKGPLRVTVAGVTSAFASPRGTIEMSRALYQKYWVDNQVVRVHLHLLPGADIQAARDEIARHFGARYRLRVLSARELLEFWREQVRRAFAGLHAVAGLVLLVVLAGMADTLAAGVVERRRELATVRAVGGRRRVIRSMVVGEGLVLGIVGLVLAGGAGVALARLWVDLTLPLLLGWNLEFHMPVWTVASIGLATVAVSMVAGMLPAAQAAAASPSEALRYE